MARVSVPERFAIGALSLLPGLSWADGVAVYRFFTLLLLQYCWDADAEAVTTGGFATEVVRQAAAQGVDLPS
eukprot:5262183-Alexandrium_andersonii.AAC.1